MFANVTMAIISAVPGLSVYIIVGANVAKEYDPPEPVPSRTPGTADPGGRPQTTKYIESISGETFSIHAKLGPDFEWNPEYNDVVLRVSIDGTKIPKLAWSCGKLRGINSPRLSIGQQCTASDTKGYEFKFGPVDIGKAPGL